MKCAFCNEKISMANGVGRRDTCPHCGNDLRCCVQCKFYDTHSYNECKEVMAEKIGDKERANFCDYFVHRGSRQKNRRKSDEAMKALEALFNK